MKILFVSAFLLITSFQQAYAQSTTAFTVDPLDSQIQFNYGRSVAISGSQIIHQVWVEITSPHVEETPPEVTGRVMYRISPDGGATWQPNKALTGVIITGYPKVAASGPYVFVTYHETIGTNLSVKLLYSTNTGMDWYSMAPQLPTPVSVPLSANGHHPSVAAFSNYVHITYAAIASTGFHEVYYSVGSITNSKLTLSNPQMVSNNNGKMPNGDSRTSWTPDIAVDGSKVFFTWTDDRWDGQIDCAPTPNACLEEVYYRRYDLAFPGVWPDEIRLTNSPSGVGHNASQIAASNGMTHITLARKPAKTIHYMQMAYTATIAGVEEPIAGGDPNITFDRPAIAAQGSNVQMVFHGFVSKVGMRLFRTESLNGGVTFSPYSPIPFSLYIARQPSIAIDGVGLKHLIFTGSSPNPKYTTTFLMYYGKW